MKTATTVLLVALGVVAVGGAAWAFVDDEPTSADYVTFHRARWAFDWYPGTGELRAFIEDPARDEPSGDYWVGTAPTYAAAAAMADAWRGPVPEATAQPRA